MVRRRDAEARCGFARLQRLSRISLAIRDIFDAVLTDWRWDGQLPEISAQDGLKRRTFTSQTRTKQAIPTAVRSADARIHELLVGAEAQRNTQIERRATRLTRYSARMNRERSYRLESRNSFSAFFAFSNSGNCRSSALKAGVCTHRLVARCSVGWRKCNIS